MNRGMGWRRAVIDADPGGNLGFASRSGGAAALLEPSSTALAGSAAAPAFAAVIPAAIVLVHARRESTA